MMCHKLSGFPQGKSLLGQVAKANCLFPFWGSRIMYDGEVSENLAIPNLEIQRLFLISRYFLPKNYLLSCLSLIALWKHHQCKKANSFVSVRGKLEVSYILYKGKGNQWCSDFWQWRIKTSVSVSCVEQRLWSYCGPWSGCVRWLR